jgi:hypothetical protein
MQVNKRIVLTVAFGLIVVIALSMVFLYSRPGKFFRLLIAAVKIEQQRKVRLLSETDYQALLEACRKISRDIDQGNLLTRKRYSVRNKPSTEVKRFPQVILDLEPRFIDTWTDGRVVLVMSGGIYHYGVTAYPENYKKPIDVFKFGDRELLPGLWYYDDGYINNPEYDKRIDELIEKHKKRTKTRDSHEWRDFKVVKKKGLPQPVFITTGIYYGIYSRIY